jgi:membrane associated rhomboid family serine protease
MSDAILPRREPIFNLPRVVILLIAALAAIQLVRDNLLDLEQNYETLLAFAFIPARITAGAELGVDFPGGDVGAAWTFLTYALLHADWGHVIVNCVWLAAFGSPLARRLGAVRFLLFSAAGAIGGACLHLAVLPHDAHPLVGASAAISAHMAGTSRFLLTAGSLRSGGHDAYRRPAQPLSVVLRDRRVLMFVGVWFALNLVFGLLGSDSGLSSGAIAWEAHVGGFLAGLLLFPLFDPVRAAPPPDRP